MHRVSWIAVIAGIAIGACGGQGGGAPDARTSKAEAPKAPPAPAALVLDVVYGSEKKEWFEEMVTSFEATHPTLASGRAIDVQARATGSGDAMAAILSGQDKPDVYSPASSAYLALLDEEWLSQAGHTAPIAGAGEPLLLSPLVIAMWRPMAEALGWPEKPLGWKDILAESVNPKGWAGHGHPEWGVLKLGHTNPKLSNSGLLAVLAEAYAGAGKSRGLTVADLNDPKTAAFVEKVEGTLVHYGKSTSFLADKMVSRGPSYVSAAVLYESQVIQASTATPAPALPIVAIYPREGTFWSDHPYVTLDAPWVGPEEKEAGKVLFDYLRARPQQERALALGFRPADPAVAIAAPLDAAHGMDPSQPQNLLEVPDGATLAALLPFWESAKKASDVTLVFDKSGSMRGEPLAKAQIGARAFLDLLGDRDQVSVLFFDNVVAEVPAPVRLGGGGRASLEARVDGTIASGGTALYEAVHAAYASALVRATEDPTQIHAVVVMTDGRDESSKTTTLDALVAEMAQHPEAPVKVFTLAYGDQADPAVLTRIADAGQGMMGTGGQKDIAALFGDMAAFF